MNLENYNLPSKPGCYLYKKNNVIIYVGKAKNLKKRVSSYFQKKDQDSKTKSLIENIDDLDFIITNSEIEALILENTLIKKHQPKYNINLKDSKQYAYLKLTNEFFPRLLTARKKDSDENYFGPFVSGSQRENLKKILIKTFKIRTCKKLPKKECLRYHINICSAPCINNISKTNYLTSVQNVKKILSGKTKDLLIKLQKKMQEQSQNQNFEKALEIREQINAVKYIEQKQNVQREKEYNEDIINYVKKNNIIYLMLFNIYKGTLNNKKEYVFDENPNFFEEFILQYYSENPIPKELILPEEISQTLKDYLIKNKSSKIIYTLPKIGEKKNLLELVKKNIELTYFGNSKTLEELQDKLNLPSPPSTIECFDISHLSGTSTVASMVQFKNGIPNKSNYRRFKIKTVQGIDDFRSIAEVVKRRYTRLNNENKNFPDLILIDGGKGQLSSALTELKKLNIKIPIISIAKKQEEIFVPARPFPLNFKRTDASLKLLQRIRDEAHRFAITYNRLLQKKSLTKSD